MTNTTTAKTVKAINYTAEQTAQMVQDYAGGNGLSVSAIAEKMGRTTRSIVAKLAREKVYVKPEYVSKDGKPVEKKDQTADAIGAILKMTEAEIESLTKANKTALQKIFSALANSVPLEG